MNAGMRGESLMSDRDQIEAWFRAYNQDIYHFLIYYTGSTDVDDLVQDVFIKAYQSMAQFKNYSSPKTWLITIARHLAIDRNRRQRHYLKLIPKLMKDIKDSEKGADSIAIDHETLNEFYEVACQLKKSYREVLLCRLLNDQTVSETAEILGWSKNKVNITYHRAIQKFKAIYPLRKGGIEHD